MNRCARLWSLCKNFGDLNAPQVLQVSLPDIDPHTFLGILQYLYTDALSTTMKQGKKKKN